MTRREILRGFGLAGAALAVRPACGDMVVAGSDKLPEGSIGDPNNVWFGRHIFPLDPTVADGPSAYVKAGKIIQPQTELPLFHMADVVVVGGGPAGFAASASRPLRLGEEPRRRESLQQGRFSCACVPLVAQLDTEKGGS